MSSPKRTAACSGRKERTKRETKEKEVESQNLSPKKTKPQYPVEPMFKLVCTSLEELRELISRTEDELDELESTKNRSVSGRWFCRKEAVKDLHITLIRLLNELSPWEPKLVKAFHRNRLRLKKDYDDFRKHPEYDNFVREQLVAEEDEDEEGERGTGRGEGASSSSSSFSDCSSRQAEEQDEEHGIPRGLWAAADLRQQGHEFMGGSLVTPQEVTTPGDLRPSTRQLKRPGGVAEDDPNLGKRGRTCGDDVTAPSSSSSSSSSSVVAGGADAQNRSGEPPPAGPARDPAPVQTASGGPGAAAPTPTAGYPRRYQPIPTLLARSVGNKVTLMPRPPPPPHPSAPPPPPPPRPVAGQTQTGTALVSPRVPFPTTAPPTAPPAPPSPAPAPLRVAEGPGGGSPAKIQVQRQVVVLPSKLLLQRPAPEETNTPRATPPAPLSSSPGFYLPEGGVVPILQVAPLKNTRTVRGGGVGGGGATPSSPSASPRQLHTPRSAGFKVAGTKTSAPQTSTAAASRPAQPPEELKTVCIRDSQSILVTTRGGNTGVVKLEQKGRSPAPAAPIITISPQFKAFLVSQTSPQAPAVPLPRPPAPGPALRLQSAFSSSFSSTPGSNIPGGQGAAGTLPSNPAPPCVASSPPAVPVSPSRSAPALAHNALLQRVANDKQPITKFILVAPSTGAAPGASSPSAAGLALPGSRLVFISQSAATSSSTGVLSQASAGGGVKGHPLTTAAADAVKVTPQAGRAAGPIRVGGSISSTLSSSSLLSSTPAALRVSSALSSSVAAPGAKAGQPGATSSSRTPLPPPPPPAHPQPSAPAVRTPPSPVKATPPGAPHQQRIVINTSAPLAAGTQILLNNARFVVPAQGLAPGSHVLLITSPAPPASAASSSSAKPGPSPAALPRIPLPALVSPLIPPLAPPLQRGTNTAAALALPSSSSLLRLAAPVPGGAGLVPLVGNARTTTMVKWPVLPSPPIRTAAARPVGAPGTQPPPVAFDGGVRASPLATAPTPVGAVLTTGVMTTGTVRAPVVLAAPTPVLARAPVRAAAPQTKLLLSPEGAVLNAVRGPAGPPAVIRTPPTSVVSSPMARVLPSLVPLTHTHSSTVSTYTHIRTGTHTDRASVTTNTDINTRSCPDNATVTSNTRPDNTTVTANTCTHPDNATSDTNTCPDNATATTNANTNTSTHTDSAIVTTDTHTDTHTTVTTHTDNTTATTDTNTDSHTDIHTTVTTHTDAHTDNTTVTTHTDSATVTPAQAEHGTDDL